MIAKYVGQARMWSRQWLLRGHKQRMASNVSMGSYFLSTSLPCRIVLLVSLWSRAVDAANTIACVSAVAFLLVLPSRAEYPFFVTYTSNMAKLGELEIVNKNVTGKPAGGNRFIGSILEFEYGATPWWTSEFYLDGESTSKESTLFTGYRWENRFRVLPSEHWINPVLYVEFENLNGADKSLLTVVGNDGIRDLIAPTAETRHKKEREIEAKLILGSSFKGWTIAENFIVEREIKRGPYEFGYAVGISRGLSLGKSNTCSFCRTNFVAGVEVYGGLGTSAGFGLNNTSHYVGPGLAWKVVDGLTVKISPNFGLTDTSARFLMRFGVSTEVEHFGRAMQNCFRRWRP
jgi:hypothetical protein